MAYADAEGLTIVPLNFGFDYEYDEATGKLTLWFHSAPRGRKLDAIRAAAGGRLPWLSPCRPTARWWRAAPRAIRARRSSRSSAMARRHWSRIRNERRHGLQTLMAQQAHMPNVEFTDAQVRSVTVWKIESDYFTTKVRAKPAPAHMHQR